MIGMIFSPPPVAHDAATQLAQVYLAAAVDPVATKARLDELNQATQAYRSAIDEHAAVAARAAEITAKENALAAREQAVTEREQAVSNAQTALNVASSANVARTKTLVDREAE